MPQRVAITGSSGLIGGALSAYLQARGDEVVRLVRHAPRRPDEVPWDPTSGRLDPRALSGLDAVVHLAGAGVGDHRWTAKYQQQILTSRVDGTATLAHALVELGEPIRLVSQSAVGFYGDRGEELLTEESSPGQGFLTEVVLAWEAAAEPARAAGLSVAHPRTGLVLTALGGALAPMLTPARLGLGGPLGGGRQYWPWITLRDTVSGLAFLIDRPDVTGPVNLVGPAPARQGEVSRELGRALGRPAVLPAPAFALRALLGGFADEILGSKRVMPARLGQLGFAHQDATLAAALTWALAQAT